MARYRSRHRLCVIVDVAGMLIRPDVPELVKQRADVEVIALGIPDYVYDAILRIGITGFGGIGGNPVMGKLDFDLLLETENTPLLAQQIYDSGIKHPDFGMIVQFGGFACQHTRRSRRAADLEVIHDDHAPLTKAAFIKCVPLDFGQRAGGAAMAHFQIGALQFDLQTQAPFVAVTCLAHRKSAERIRAYRRPVVPCAPAVKQPGRTGYPNLALATGELPNAWTSSSS